MNCIIKMSFTLCVIATLIGSGRAVRASENNLQMQLQKIDRKRSGMSGEMSKLEQEALLLLKTSASEEETAEVYFSIAQMYVNDGIRNSDKVIEYSGKALDIPQDVIRTCQLHLFWGDALKKKLVKVKGMGRVQMRREALAQYLEAFDIVLQRKKANEIQPLPAVNLYDYDGSTNDPEYQAISRKQKKELETYRKVKLQNELVRYEKKIVCRATSLYSSSDVRLLKEDIGQIRTDKKVADILLQKVSTKQ